MKNKYTVNEYFLATNVMLVNIAHSYSMHGARLHKTSRRDAMTRDSRRDLLRRDQDILLRDRDETREGRDASVRDGDETETLRILSETRPRRDVSTSRNRL